MLWCPNTAYFFTHAINQNCDGYSWGRLHGACQYLCHPEISPFSTTTKTTPVSSHCDPWWNSLIASYDYASILAEFRSILIFFVANRPRKPMEKQLKTNATKIMSPLIHLVATWSCHTKLTYKKVALLCDLRLGYMEWWGLHRQNSSVEPTC